jgi:hypothetical protein
MAQSEPQHTEFPWTYIYLILLKPIFPNLLDSKGIYFLTTAVNTNESGVPQNICLGSSALMYFSFSLVLQEMYLKSILSLFPEFKNIF